MVLDTKRGDKKVTISTINSIQAKFRKMARNTRHMAWIRWNMGRKRYLWSICSDSTRCWPSKIFPHEARDKKGNLLQTEQAWLIQSTITRSYIILVLVASSQKDSRQKQIIDRSQSGTGVKLSAGWWRGSNINQGYHDNWGYGFHRSSARVGLTRLGWIRNRVQQIRLPPSNYPQQATVTNPR